MKLYKGLTCPLDNYELLLFSLTGGADGKTYPFCECGMCLSARGACSSLLRSTAVLSVKRLLLSLICLDASNALGLASDAVSPELRMHSADSAACLRSFLFQPATL